MKKLALAIALAFPVVLIAAQGTDGPGGTKRWRSKELDGAEPQIAEKSRAAKPPTAALDMLSLPTHRISMRHRSGTAPAEQHPDVTDVFVIKSGSAMFQIGGEIVEPTGQNGELRGPSIRGGETFAIGAGDVINLPSKVAHQMLLKPGETITFFTIKVMDKPAP